MNFSTHLRWLRRPRTLFWLILAVGVFFIFFRLTRADLISDDAHYSFRALDYIDFVSSQNQTTPLQWFGSLPWWSRFSFHDAPPLVFLIQHIFFSFLGPGVFAARLPFALAGVATLVLTYLLAKKLYGERVALVAMLVLAIQNYFIWPVIFLRIFTHRALRPRMSLPLLREFRHLRFTFLKMCGTLLTGSTRYDQKIIHCRPGVQ